MAGLGLVCCYFCGVVAMMMLMDSEKEIGFVCHIQQLTNGRRELRARESKLSLLATTGLPWEKQNNQMLHFNV